MKEIFQIFALFLLAFFSRVNAQEPILSNSDFIPLPVISHFDDYDAEIDIDPNGTTVNSVSVRTTMINGEEVDPQNPVLGTEYFTNGDVYSNGVNTSAMTNEAGNTWSYSQIRPDDIYTEIFYVPTDVAYDNSPNSTVLDKSNYQIFKMENPFTMVDNSQFFIEFYSMSLESLSAIDLQVYIIGNNKNISFFEGSDWRENADVEMVGTIGRSDDFHHIHTANSRHHLIRLSTNPDQTVGNNHIDISGDFWIVLMAPTPSRRRAWSMMYHDKSKNGGRDNDGGVNTTLSAEYATWFIGDQTSWTTTPKSGLPDAHVHMVRSGYDSESNEIKDMVRVEYIVDYTYNQITTTKKFSENHLFQSIPNLLPNASAVIDPLPCEYNGNIDISWFSATDPNKDNLTYNVYILDAIDGTVVMTPAVGISETIVPDVDISSLADGFFNIKIEACDASGCQSFMWDGLFGNTGDHLFFGGAGSLHRTKGTGSWANVGIWEVNTDVCDSWISASGPPDQNYSGWVMVSSTDSVVVEAGTTIPLKGLVEGVVNVQGDVLGDNLILGPGARVFCAGDWNVSNVTFGNASVILNGSSSQVFKANSSSFGNMRFEGGGVKTLENGTYDINIEGDLEIASESQLNQVGGNLNISGQLILESSSASNATFLPIAGSISVADDSVQVQQLVSFSGRVYDIAVPVSGNTTPASAGITSGIYKWDNALGRWEIVSSDEVMQRGRGYVCMSSNDLSYSGEIAQSDVDVLVTRTVNGLGWNFLGNPFTAGIDWDNLAFDVNKIADNFWLWNQESQVYSTYSGATQIGVNLDDENPSVIPSGHSFWVKVKTGYTSVNFPFLRSDRVGNSHSYLKSTDSLSYESIRLFGHAGQNIDEIAIVDVDVADAGIDIYDSDKMFSGKGGVLEIFTRSGNSDLSINSLPVSPDVEIPLGYSSQQTGQYAISVASDLNDFEVVLRDNVAQKAVNLSQSGEYRFEVLQSGINEDRFVISFLAKVATNIEKKEDDKDIRCYSDQGRIFAEMNNLSGEVSFMVFDLSGRMIEDGRLSGIGNCYIGTFGIGVYLIRFESQADEAIRYTQMILL